MRLFYDVARVLWIVAGVPLMVIAVITALTIVFSILGVVAMFAAMAVPFGFAPPVLQWLSKPKREG